MERTDESRDDGTEVLDLVNDTLGLAGVREDVDLVRVFAHIQSRFEAIFVYDRIVCVVGKTEE